MSVPLPVESMRFPPSARLGIGLTLALLFVIGVGFGCARKSQRIIDLEAYEKIEVDEARLARYPQALREAVTAYNNRDYATAAAGFYEVLQDARFRAAHVSVRYYLAESLDRLGLYRSAMYELGQLLGKLSAADTDAYTAAALKKLLALTKITRFDQTVTGVLRTVPLEKFPGAFRNELIYISGRRYFQEREYDLALTTLNKVETTSAFYAKSLYVMAVAHVIQKNYPEARRTFQKIRDLPTTYSDFGEAGKVKEMTKLALGQFLYKAGYEAATYDGERGRRALMTAAIEFYDQVDRDTEAWFQALFQKTWASTLLGRSNTALGTIHTLDSPYFESQFLPESALIDIITWYRLCKFDEAEERAARFVGTYQPMRESTAAFLKKYAGAKQADDMFYRVLFSYRYRMGAEDHQCRQPGHPARCTFQDDAMRKDLDRYLSEFGPLESPENRARLADFRAVLDGGAAAEDFEADLMPLPVLTHVVIADPGFRDRHQSIVNTRRELLRAKQLGAFTTTRAGAAYTRLLERSLAGEESRAGRNAADALERIERDLALLLGKAATIQFELADARRKQEELKELLGPEYIAQVAAREREMYTEATAENEYYWPFDGEYWKDELGYYLYAVDSACLRAAQ